MHNNTRLENYNVNQEIKSLLKMNKNINYANNKYQNKYYRDKLSSTTFHHQILFTSFPFLPFTNYH